MRWPFAAVIVVAILAAAACSSTADDASPGGPAPASAAAQSASPQPPGATAQAAVSDPATGGLTSFYDAGSSADAAVLRLRDKGRGDEADLIQLIADQPVGIWLGGWTAGPTATIESITASAAKAEQIPVFIVYNVPGRDCGLYSAGGLSEETYLAWIQEVADGIVEGAVAWFILEPDALAQLGDCDGQGDRVHLLAEAARILDEAGGRVFLDVGHSHWNSAELTAQRIALVGTEHLTGLSTNTSNYNATGDEVAWGSELSALTGLPFITDTSRNGNGATADGQWCNPRGRALGAAPAIVDADGPLIAYVWAKMPGESDGECNGGPRAGEWWEEIAIELAGNAAD